MASSLSKIGFNDENPLQGISIIEEAPEMLEELRDDYYLPLENKILRRLVATQKQVMPANPVVLTFDTPELDKDGFPAVFQRYPSQY